MRTLGVHAGQNFLLEALRQTEPLTMGQLAQRLHVEVPTVVRMTQRMESAGLLQRETDAQDRRRALISLTPEGHSAAHAIPGILDTVSEQALQDLGSEEREALTRLLSRVAENLDWPPTT